MKRNLIVVGIIVCMLLVGSTAAYFTDRDSVVNEFTVGNVDVELLEPNWDETNAEAITPEQEIAKDPQISNTGVNNAYVFMKVTVPVAEVTTSGSDGSLIEKARHELFTYKLNDGWTLIDTVKGETETVFTYAYVDELGQIKKLLPSETTSSVFDSVKFINIVEGQLDGMDLSIDVEAIGIQADNLQVSTSEDVYKLVR